jgi:sarcosine oxidase subunit delta
VLLISCPWCGPRAEMEFGFGGEADVAYPPDQDALSDDEWAEFLYVRNNPRGPSVERWVHSVGCRRWFTAVRDTVSNEFSVDVPGEPRGVA